MILLIQERENGFRKGHLPSQDNRSIYEKEIRDNARKNLIVSAIPLFFGLEEREIKFLTKLRLVSLTSLLGVYYFEKNHFPSIIKEIDNEATIDPITNKPWEYNNLKDSVIISSPGIDLNDNIDNISLTLKKTNIGR